MKRREDAKSQKIRLSLGLLTPDERRALAEAEAARRQVAQKKAQKGKALGLDEVPHG